MKNESCERYLEDPDANASHLETCEECRALFAPADVAVKAGVVSVDSLPMAPWEGASHRSWALAIAAGVVVLFSAVTLFLMAGVAPVTGLLRSLSTAVPSADLILSASRLVGNGLQHAPLSWQLAIGVGFLAVNTVFILLLRRAPRGIDV